MATLGRLSVQLGADVAPLQRGFKNAEGAIQNFKNSTGKAQSGLNNLANSSGKTTSAVVNLNRVIQDAPFGILGVANNIEPLVNSFNQLRSEAGSVRGAITTLLKKSFTGPGALITVTSLASTALLVYTMRMRKAGGATKETEESVKQTAKAVDGLTDSFNKLASFSLTQEAQREIAVLDEVISKVEERGEIERDVQIRRLRASQLREAGQAEEALAEQRIIDARNNEIAVINKQIQFYGIEETSLDKLNEKRDIAKSALEGLNNAQTDQQKLALFVDDAQSKATQTLQAYGAQLAGSETAVLQLQDALRAQIATFREASNAGNTDLIPIIVELQKQLDKLTDASEKARVRIDVEPPEDNVIVEDFSETFNIIKDFYENNPSLVIPIKPKVEAPDDVLLDDDLFISVLPDGDSLAFGGVINGVQAIVDTFRLELPPAIDEATYRTEQMSESTKALAGFADMVGGAFAQAVIQGRRLDDALKGILAQLASRAFVVGLGSILTGGASLGGASFLGNVFGGVFHTGGIVPGRGEKLALVQGGEGVFTQDQMKALGSMQASPPSMNIRLTGELTAKGQDLRLTLEEANYKVFR